MNTTFTLSGGLEISLAALHQFHTYEGLIEGLPTERMNKARIERASKFAVTQFSDEPFIVDPPQTPIDHDGDYPFGTPASIPGITVVSRWRVYTVEDDEHGSRTLTMISFQDTFALPFDDSATSVLVDVDWFKYSTFYPI